MNKAYNVSEILATWGDDWDKPEWWEGYNSKKVSTKKKHDWKPTLLVFTTVYECKCCGVKQEDAKTEYCEEHNDDWDMGGGL